MKKIIGVIGNPPISKTLLKSIGQKVIVIEGKENPFEPEPILFTNPYKDYDEIINKKYYDKPKSKHHK